MNNISLTGRLTKVPETRQVGEYSIVSFTLAVERRDKNRTTDFIPCQAWNKTGAIIATYAKKGDMVGVTGSLETRSYDKDGERRTAFDINVSSVDLLGGKKEDTAPTPQPLPVPPLLNDADYNYLGGADNDSTLPFSIE